jgi:hypothetical protein
MSLPERRDPPRRQILSSVLLLALLLLSSSPSAEAGSRKSFVTHDCYHVKIKPRTIMFACGDGNYYVNDLQWQAWNRGHAIGEGVFHQNDCTPSCADGTFYQSRGELELSERLWCEDIDRYVFRRAAVKYQEPLVGRKGSRFRLFCPIAT